MAVERAASPTPMPEHQRTAVALAYEFIRPSYDIMLKRLELVEGRIRTLLTLAASLTFGVPIFATAVRGQGALSYSSPWLLAALSCAGFILIVGALGSVGRRVDVPGPALLHAAALDDRYRLEWEFQQYALEGAADAWTANRARLEWKARIADWIAGALLVETALMVIWVLRG